MWNYCGAEINDDANKNVDANNEINNNKKITNKSFRFNAKVIGSTPNDDSRLSTKVVVSLK